MFPHEVCRINVTDEIPIAMKPYNCSFEVQQIIDDHVNKLLRQGLIEKSVSPYAFPVILADKKMTVATMKPQDKEKTAFITKHGHYQWLRMPFGLKNAPMIFQRAIWNILETHNLTQFCHNYLDDIIIFSKTYEEHISHVHAVLKALQNSNAILKFSKCQLLKNSVIYLGHRISKNQVQPLDNNIEAILKVERPKDVKGVKSFLGQINYYHRFIENRYKILQPLIDLTKKSHEYSKLRYDANRKQLNLNVGDKIFVESGNRLNRDKLDPLFEGPYTITRIISKNIIEIMKKNKPTIVHSSQIKIFKDEAIEENECRFRF
ncbi:Retrovirus-related Pol polyprotein from transposon 17.6 [Sarcoptes scabiei]|uniref:Retrovirus-related Pol polyprotein from transposon 17.6 n=1 Tax=Sarcoptes scabiei TaxID=52283 RepID=A0A834R021_SARSC|nr:Retrovirus-related Pol polyprotein from transposon 17.6 [Sarcoptes scabiei]